MMGATGAGEPGSLPPAGVNTPAVLTHCIHAVGNIVCILPLSHLSFMPCGRQAPTHLE